ncbi:hypothetical protein Trydic_g19218 [Trypoxylus dichotomus]
MYNEYASNVGWYGFRIMFASLLFPKLVSKETNVALSPTTHAAYRRYRPDCRIVIVNSNITSSIIIIIIIHVVVVVVGLPNALCPYAYMPYNRRRNVVVPSDRPENPSRLKNRTKEHRAGRGAAQAKER